MLHMCVYMHSHFIKNHPIQILEDIALISGSANVLDGGNRRGTNYPWRNGDGLNPPRYI
jgi:hypothetical protein